MCFLLLFLLFTASFLSLFIFLHIKLTSFFASPLLVTHVNQSGKPKRLFVSINWTLSLSWFFPAVMNLNPSRSEPRPKMTNSWKEPLRSAFLILYHLTKLYAKLAAAARNSLDFQKDYHPLCSTHGRWCLMRSNKIISLTALPISCPTMDRNANHTLNSLNLLKTHARNMNVFKEKKDGSTCMRQHNVDFDLNEM